MFDEIFNKLTIQHHLYDTILEIELLFSTASVPVMSTVQTYIPYLNLKALSEKIVSSIKAISKLDCRTTKITNATFIFAFILHYWSADHKKFVSLDCLCLFFLLQEISQCRYSIGTTISPAGRK